MGSAVIGIKTAKGEFYPVMDASAEGKKRMILTTARKNQASVKIDLYLQPANPAEALRYLGTLFLEDIRSGEEASRGAGIEFILGRDRDGNINATAKAGSLGETRSLSVYIDADEFRDDLQEEFEIPDLDFDSDMGLDLDLPDGFEDTETVLSASEEDLSFPEDLEEDEGEDLLTESSRRGVSGEGISPFMLTGFVVLGLLIILMVAYFILRGTQPQEVPPLQASLSAASMAVAFFPVSVFSRRIPESGQKRELH